MKLTIKIILFLTISFFLAGTVSSQTPTPTPTPALQKPSPAKPIDRQVKILKEKIATKVAEMQKGSKRVIRGEILKMGEDSFDLKTPKGELYKVAFDDVLTKIFNVTTGAKKTVDFNTLTKGDLVIVAGPAIENTINANIIYVDQEFLVGSGRVVEIDKTNFFIKVISTDKTEYTIDIESFTKQQLLDTSTLSLSSYGFSKLKEGDTVHFAGKKATDKKSNRFPANKIVIIPQESFIKN